MERFNISFKEIETKVKGFSIQDASLQTNVQEKDKFAISFKSSDSNVNLGFSSYQTIRVDRPETYIGPYNVESTLDQNVIFQTKDKMMSDNVTVIKVPTYETSNDAGGVTFYIGRSQINGQ